MMLLVRSQCCPKLMSWEGYDWAIEASKQDLTSACIFFTVLHSLIKNFLIIFSGLTSFKLDSFTLGEWVCSPTKHLGLLKNSFKLVRAFQIELKFKSVGFWGRGKWSTGKKLLGAKERTNNKLSPHMVLLPRLEPGPHWWEASALTTRGGTPIWNRRGCSSSRLGV